MEGHIEMKVKNLPGRRQGRGVVIVIAALFATSAALRIVTVPGAASAETRSTGALGVDHLGPSADPLTARDAAPLAEADLSRAEMSDLLAALRAREESVRAAEQRIEMRSKALAVADEEITKRLAVLEQAEENLRRTLAFANGAAEEDLARLTTVYENMKPKEAAALFQTMEPDFAAGFLARMRPDAAAAVMAGMPPEVAYSISVILAGRNANAPKS